MGRRRSASGSRIFQRPIFRIFAGATEGWPASRYGPSSHSGRGTSAEFWRERLSRLMNDGCPQPGTSICQRVRAGRSGPPPAGLVTAAVAPRPGCGSDGWRATREAAAPVVSRFGGRGLSGAEPAGQRCARMGAHNGRGQAPVRTGAQASSSTKRHRAESVPVATGWRRRLRGLSCGSSFPG
jgi:hypothetical protein